MSKLWGVWWVVLLASLATPVWADRSLTLGATLQSMPFAHLVTEVAAEAGWAVQVVELPMTRLIIEARAGRIGGGFFLTPTALESLPGVLRVDVPLYENQLVAVTLRPEIRVRRLVDLGPWVVAIERGNEFHRLAAFSAAASVEATTQESQFRMLLSGRADVAVTARALVPGLLRRVGAVGATVQEPPLLRESLFLFLTPVRASALPALTEAFRRAVDSGRWGRAVGEVLARLGGAESPSVP